MTDRPKEPDMCAPDPTRVACYLSDLSFPASKRKVLDSAKAGGVGKEVLDRLGRLPEREFQSMTELMQIWGATVH